MQNELGSNPTVNAQQSFFRSWYARLEDLLGQFESAERRIDERSSDHERNGGGDFEELIAQALDHYEQYFMETWRISHEDVFLLFTPPWLSRFELSLLWIVGFHPVLLFRIVFGFINDLSPDQAERIHRGMEETKAKERALSDELAKFQESVGSELVVGAARSDRRWVNAEIAAMEALRSAARVLVAGADLLRAEAVREVIGILNPMQTVRFLRAGMKMQIGIRNFGMERDAAGNRG